MHVILAVCTNRMELVEKVLGYDFEGYERTIDSHVKNLRAKLGDDPKKPTWLFTVHGVGYRFEAPQQRRKSNAQKEPLSLWHGLK